MAVEAAVGADTHLQQSTRCYRIGLRRGGLATRGCKCITSSDTNKQLCCCLSGRANLAYAYLGMLTPQVYYTVLRVVLLLEAGHMQLLIYPLCFLSTRRPICTCIKCNLRKWFSTLYAPKLKNSITPRRPARPAGTAQQSGFIGKFFVRKNGIRQSIAVPSALTRTTSCVPAKHSSCTIHN